MRYFKFTILCLCFFTAFLFQINVDAADNDKISDPAIVFEDNTSYSIDLVDSEREAGKIIMYTRNYGEFTKPFEANTREFIVVNNIVTYISTDGAKGTYIPPNGYVISFTGSDTDFINSLYVGRGFTLVNIDAPAAPDMYFKLDGMLVPIDKVNSIRDANQVVLYNSSYGTSTKTNVWGMELTVVNNVITRLVDMTGGKEAKPENNSAIPSDGTVISIHSGSPYYKLVHEKAKLGDNVTISDDSSILYNAAKIKYAAYNPRTITDNPGAWDMTQGKPYDGFRGPNQLIIYDSSYGEQTGTNPYGYEVTVSNEGKITRTGGSNSEIPAGGYILSGHGNCLTWLEKNARLGATVVVNADRKEISIVLTPDSYANSASYSIKSAQNSLNLAKQQYLDIPYDKVQSVIDIAGAKLINVQKQVAQGYFEGLINAAKEIQQDADNAYYMTFESPKAENRAVWIRPRETNVNEVIEKLDMLKGINVNTIYLETYWNGYAIYPTGNKLMQQNPIFNGFDVLASYIKEAHSRGIELHAWVENFLVDLPVAEKKPEWMAVSRKGDIYYLENGTTKYYLMNPALPEVHDFLSGLYTELVKKYSLDGLQFDYMRYSHSGDYSNDFGYDAYTRQLFVNYTGTDPIVLKPGDALWEEWCGFRTYLVNSYAYRMISELKSVKPDIQISADVWPEYDKTIIDIYQDPKAWVSQDYINALIPMSYYLNEAPVVEDALDTRAFAIGHSQVTSGIATFNKVDTKVFLRQINAARAANTSGVAIFESDSLFKGGYDKALKLGAFSAPAAVPNRDPGKSIELLLKEIVRKIDDIYVRCDGINAEQAEKYKKLIGEIRVNLKGDNDEAKAAYSLKNDIEKTLEIVNSDASLNGEIAKRISIDLNSAVNIADAYISSLRFMTGHEVKKFQAELPFKTLESNKAVPLKVKAIFSDNAAMYLDRSQYSIKSANPAYAEITGDMLIIKAENDSSEITIDILDSFSFNTIKGTDKKVEFNLGEKTNNSAYGILSAAQAGYTGIKLDWGSPVIDSAIVGYIVYRNDKEIVRISSDMYMDRDLQPGEVYTYMVHGFDASGNIVYESNQVTVKTKGPLLLTGQQ